MTSTATQTPDHTPSHTPTPTPSRKAAGKATRLLGGLAALALLGAACANQSPEETTEAAATPSSVAETQPAPAAGTGAPAALLGRSGLGDVMIGPDGLTMYGFTNDTAAASTCYDACAEAWPPVIVDRDWTVGPGLDIGIFATTVRDDGSLQLVAGKWPLYYYIDDQNLGDINGQGSGDVWFAIDPNGVLIKDGAPDDGYGSDGGDDAAAPASVLSTGSTDLGTVLVDSEGLTLYGFTNDVDGQPSCDGDCADAWPPLLVDELPADLDPAKFSVVTRTDGSTQLAVGVWPLYRFAGDSAPGETNGQGSGGVWFAVAEDGSLIGRNGSGEDASASVTVDEGGVTVSEGY